MGHLTEINIMVDSDWEQVRGIYIEGIKTGNATFETTAPTWEAWNHSYDQECRFVACENNQVVGWAALSPISKRAAYRGVAEVSIYLSAGSVGKGIGSMLLNHTIEKSEENGFWTLQANIFPENRASIQLHEKYGFTQVGIRKKIGKLNGEWRDVVLLDRRSRIVGLD